MSQRALIVEDERDTAELLAEILRRRGFEPTVFQEGKPALVWSRSQQPDLILLDLMLPDVDGYQVCEDLKLDRETNLIPIVMVTARDQPRDRVHGFEVGANSYLTKPFSVDQLVAAVDTAMSWRDELAQTGAQGEIRFDVKSDTSHLEELNDLLSALFLFSGLSEKQARQLMTAVREIGLNAIEWGHQRQIERLVNVTYQIANEKVTIVIRDSGPGFDPKNLPHAATADDPTSHFMVREALGLREGGFGLVVARGLVDEMIHNEAGNEVKLIKYFGSAAKPAPRNGSH